MLTPVLRHLLQQRAGKSQAQDDQSYSRPPIWKHGEAALH
jgi:hypothetical protein